MFDEPVSFSEAVKHLAAKGLMPTGLDSEGIRKMDAALRRRAFYSAKTTNADLLGKYKELIGSIVEPKQETRILPVGPTLPVTVGDNPASVRAKIKLFLGENGYVAAEGEEGTIKDLSSDARINLVVKTNVELAQGAGLFVQSNLDEDVVDLWPAWELVRYEEKDKPRDWEQRWKIAAEVCGDAKALACMVNEGRMCALKSSEIWQALGDGEGGYTDTLGNPYPPFAFNSGMWCDDVRRSEAEELGLIEEGEEVEGAKFDFGSLFGEQE